jgi:hypothetical protein
MNTNQLTQTLREFIRREPFEPFVVELQDGHTIEVLSPNIVVGGAGAAFLTPNFDLVEFSWEEVRAIRPMVSGATR